MNCERLRCLYSVVWSAGCYLLSIWWLRSGIDFKFYYDLFILDQYQAMRARIVNMSIFFSTLGQLQHLHLHHSSYLSIVGETSLVWFTTLGIFTLVYMSIPWVTETPVYMSQVVYIASMFDCYTQPWISRISQAVIFYEQLIIDHAYRKYLI
jgi:hypothetical protein